MGFTRRTDPTLATDVQISYTHASTTATLLSDVGYVVPAGRTLVVDRVIYVNPTGLATSGTNYFTIAVLGAAVVAATTDTSAVSLAAGVQRLLTLSGTVANLSIAGGVAVRLNLALTGTQTLPAGSIRIEGRLL